MNGGDKEKNKDKSDDEMFDEAERSVKRNKVRASYLVVCFLSTKSGICRDFELVSFVGIGPTSLCKYVKQHI